MRKSQSREGSGVEHLREFWRQVKLLIDFTVGNIFMRVATLMFLILTLALFADEQFENECRVAVCRWFGAWAVGASWAAAIVAQMAPRRWRRRYIPEAFLTLVIPLLAIAGMLIGSQSDPIAQAIVTPMLVFPLMANIFVGIVDTARRWRRLMMPQRGQRRRRTMS